MSTINQAVDGIAQYSEISESFTFHPLLPQQGHVKNFKRKGTAQQLSDGSFEFQPRQWPRSHAWLIKKLTHGRLSETVNGEYLLTVRIPRWELSPCSILADNCRDALQALDIYTYSREEGAA